ncbi:MAG: metallophosphoesterase [Candidatus Micrarchaeota archaeon]|nr:metallophosphoesterase [Candidatus Micrarchaeota archaeon]
MRFITNEPAIFHKNALIIGDTHFGIEDKLRLKGIYQNNFTDLMVDRIKKLIKMTKAKKLIILGDVKENITIVDEKTKQTIEELEKIVEITIVRGNHDGGIETVCKDVKPSEGYIYENLGLIHGHSWPSEEIMNCDYLISAHQHPQIEFIDKSGKRHVETAWLVLPANKTNLKKFYKKFNEKMQLILLPSFNPLAGKTLKYDDNEHLGPLFKNKLFKYNDAISYRLDGVCIGKLKNHIISSKISLNRS